MKVVKRDGRIVSYDRQKIVAAIENANRDVEVNEQASISEIKGVLAYIEDMHKNRILVEDIQDMVEEKLKEYNKGELANEYKMFKYRSSEALKEAQNPVMGILINDRQLIS